MIDEVVLQEQGDNQYVVDGVPVTPTSCESDQDVEPSNSVSFTLQTAGLAVQIQTKVAPNMVVAELQSKLEFALIKLSENESRLDAAMRRIGYLEAHLETKTAEVLELSSRLGDVQPSQSTT